MSDKSLLKKVTPAGLLITLGIVYGDIGTSPLYVMKAIVGDNPINKATILGAISAVIWTLTIQTTIKYVVFTLQADNRGEGGILSLYALIRKLQKKYLFIPAIIGGSALLADGIITPPISVTSAVEGIHMINPSIPVVPIVCAILLGLFIFQRFGTAVVGRLFGPIMTIWFVMLAVVGAYSMMLYPAIIHALNPYYAIQMLATPGGFWLLGAVFLCTTGAEALYSDMGHVGRSNIRGSWPFVKLALVINYMGQGAWLIAHEGQKIKVNGEELNPFYAIMPEWFQFSGIIIATMAAVIASQALISGSYTLISEAIRLNFWPKVKIDFPSTTRGQVYIPSINTLMLIGCLGITLHFQESGKMEAAYGLAITLTMLSTTFLLFYYMRLSGMRLLFTWLIIGLFGIIEVSFFIANAVKFKDGGYVTILVASILIIVMYSLHMGRKIKYQNTEFVSLLEHIPLLKKLSQDTSMPKYATNLVYLTSANKPNEVEDKIIYSIFNKRPKRADVYWFVHLDVLDDPHTREYRVEYLHEHQIIKVDFRLGFRVPPRINVYFRKVVEDLVAAGEIDPLSRYTSLREAGIFADYRFVVIERIFNSRAYTMPWLKRMIMMSYNWLKTISLTEEKAFGLDTSLVTVEKVPLINPTSENAHIQRLNTPPRPIDRQEETDVI